MYVKILDIASGGTGLSSLGGALQILRTNSGATAIEYVTLNTSIVPESSNLYWTNARTISALLTGYTSGAGTISASDSVLTAIQKLNGNVSSLVTGVSSVNGLTGAVALTGTTNRLTISGANVFDIANTYVGQSSITTLGTITTGTWNGTAIADSYISSATNWNTAYTNRITSLTTTGSSGAATLVSNVLNIPNYTINGLLPSQTGNSGKYLTTDGTSSSWGTISGMTNPMTTLGDLVYEDATPTPARLAGNTTTAKQFLTQTGNGTISAAPSWFDLFGTSNSFSVNQNFTVTPSTSGSLTSIAATFGSTSGSGTIRVGQNGYFSSATTGSFTGTHLTSADASGTIWLSNATVGGTNVIVNLGGSTGTGASNGGTINGIKALTTYNGVTTFDNVATNAGNSLKFRSKNTSSTQLDRVVIDGWATTAPINMINSVVNIGGTSIITANSTLQVSGSFSLAFATKTGNYTMTSSDCMVNCNSASALTITLPTAVGCTGREYVIKNINTGAVTIACNGAETIDGFATKQITNQYGCIVLYSNNVVWFIKSQM